MSKKESTLLNMILSLLVITLIAGLSLGFVDNITKGPKAKAKLAHKINALQLVMPKFDNNPVLDVARIKLDHVKDSVEIYPAFSEHNFIGSAVVGSSDKGFSGLIKIMVGFTTDGIINNIVVLDQKETPGLGAKMTDDKFIAQYRDKNPSDFNVKVKKDGGKIDALTGATISSRAFSESVQMAYDVFVTNSESIKKEK